MESCGRSAENLSGGGGLNGSSLLEQVPPRHSPAAAALVITVVTFIMALTILGNVLVVVAVFTSRALRAPQNLFLVSLSSADILVAALVIPFTLAHEVMGSWYFGSVWCGIYLALDVLFCTSSIVHLCAISLDRYWSVTRAVQYNLKRTPKRIKQMIGVVWLISGVISLPPLAAMDPSHNHTGCCDLNSNTWYVLSSCVVSFFAPCVIMVSVYFRIYRVAKQRTSCVSVSGNGVSREASQPETCFANKAKVEPVSPSSTSHQRREELEDIDLEESLSSRELSERKPQTPTDLASNTEPNPGWSRSRTLQLLVEQRKCPRAGLNKNKAFQMRERRFTVVLAVVIGVFVVCWFPFFFTYSLKAICGHSCAVPDRLFGFFFWLGYCNSSLNPIIYTIFNRDFRKAFKRILFRTRERPL